MSDIKLPGQVYRLRQGDFGAIPGSPWVYWASKNLRDLFNNLPKVKDLAQPRVGLQTSDNPRFLRFWWEVSIFNIGFDIRTRDDAQQSNKKWFLYVKGGINKSWYGNLNHIVNWFNDGEEISNTDGAVIRNADFYFQEGLTFNRFASSRFAIRWLKPGYIFDCNGPSIFGEATNIIFALANSAIFSRLCYLINPTVNFQVGDILKVPVIPGVPKSLLIAANSCVRCVFLEQTNEEDSLDFRFPVSWSTNGSNLISVKSHLSTLESIINNEAYRLYGISQNDRSAIETELAGGNLVTEEEENNETEDAEKQSLEVVITQKDIANDWLSYAFGIILGRFHPGTPGMLGSAIYRRTDFAIGSMTDPTEEEYNELIGDPSQFAYIDEQGGRHVFSLQIEVALQKLAVPDGITVFDPNHSHDLPTLVSKALELMLGQEQAQEVVQQAAGGDLRKFLEKDFFTQHHIKQYRKRPVYWPIQSAKRSYGFVLFHEKIDRNTFYALQQEPYLPTKRRAVQLRLEELGKKVLTVQGAVRKPIEKEMDELRQLAEELAQFAKDLDAITRGGYEPEVDWIDDGVILRMAPLWSVIPLWKSEPKKYWDELAAGKYDWSRIAMKYWPERVKKACMQNKSFAIAHGHEDWYQG